MLLQKVIVICTWAVCLLAVCTVISAFRLEKVGEMEEVTQEPERKETTTETEVTAGVTLDGTTRCIDPLMKINNSSSEQSLIEQVEAHTGFHLRINETCPITGLTYHIKEPINNRSMCPWHYKSDEGKSGRIPEFLFHAVCNCTNCSMLHAESASCTPIIKPIPVLYRTECVDGLYKYIMAEEKMSVACVCSHSSIV